MSEPIRAQVEHDLGIALRVGGATVDDVRRVWDDITHHNQPHAYHQDNTGTTQEGHVSSLLDEGIAKAEDLVAHLKGLAEQALPPLEALQGSKIAQVAEKYVLGPDAEQFIADMVDGMAAKYGTAKPAAAVTTPAAETPAPDPSAPAEPQAA